MKYDMLKWMTFQSELGDYHLVSNKDGHPEYSKLNFISTRYYLIKGEKGFPWDIFTYDGTLIYQWVTELTWSDPTTYKRFLTPIPMVQRYAEPGRVILRSPDSRYELHDNLTNPTKDVGIVKFELSGPSIMNFGGDLPKKLLTLMVQYSWGGKADGTFSDIEQYYYGFPYGLVQWKHFQSPNSLIDTNTNNTIAPGAAPEPMLPPELQ